MLLGFVNAQNKGHSHVWLGPTCCIIIMSYTNDGLLEYVASQMAKYIVHDHVSTKTKCGIMRNISHALYDNTLSPPMYQWKALPTSFS